MLYALILTAVIQDLGLSRETGGLMASLTLGASAVGGLLFGVLADKVGRTRALNLSILLYSVFTFACGFAQNEWRSEEHTSELQSQSNLVCRLLHEKKQWNTS